MRFRPDGDVNYQLDKILNNGIEFADHMKGVLIERVLDEGENKVRHGLGYVPFGFIVMGKSGPGDIYATKDQEWTSEIMFLKSDVQNLKVRLFVT